MIRALTNVQEVFGNVRKHRQGTSNNLVVKNTSKKRPLAQRFSKQSPQVSSINITWEFVKKFGARPQIH